MPNKLNLSIHEHRQSLGECAADAIIKDLQLILKEKENARVVFAAAPSQNETLQTLVSRKSEVDWSRIEAFHMDEYVGLEVDDGRGFYNFLDAALFSKLPFYKLNRITSGNEKDIQNFIDAYEKSEIDMVCMGIGENGHIAFNDPPVADFADPKVLKRVQLDLICRQQQVNDGMFASLSEVPEYAMTLTVPALLKAKILHCMVPGLSKAKAISKTIRDEISTHCPSTILRQHDHCTVYVDRDSMSLSA